MSTNRDDKVIAGFGEEWDRFPQDRLPEEELKSIFENYFAVFPWDKLPPDAEGADIGCGSGRWARFVAPRVGNLHCIDPSEQALAVAQRNLAAHGNLDFHLAAVDSLPLPEASLDFAYSLGVLHHVPETADAIRVIASKLKPGAPLLLYLYYSLDNRPWWYQMVWRLSDMVRRPVSRFPFRLRYLISQILATLVYWPLARSARLLERLGLRPTTWPLSEYRDKSFYVMRTDALDRFGTRLEQRFSREEITQMLEQAGFHIIRFSKDPPYWCVVGVKKDPPAEFASKPRIR